LATRPALISAARPTSPLPVLLFTTVRPVAPWSINAWINSIGLPASPNPPIITVTPSGMSATAAAGLSTVLLIIGQSAPVDTSTTFFSTRV
jgi:hypothetical protein